MPPEIRWHQFPLALLPRAFLSASRSSAATNRTSASCNLPTPSNKRPTSQRNIPPSHKGFSASVEFSAKPRTQRKVPMNRCRLTFVAAVAILLAVPALIQASPKPSDKDLAEITARGILLAGYDQAAWHASDAVQATHPPDGKVQRYIARKTATGWAVDFGRLNSDSSKFLVAYEI